MDAVVAYFQASWPTWLGIAIAALPSLITALTAYPRVDGALKEVLQFLNLFSILVHKDSPSTLKAPFTFSKPPLGATVRYGHVGPTVAAVFLFCLVNLNGCAGVAWNSPVFTAGPTVSPIEEVTLKTSKTATTAGFSECVGLGQFEAVEHEWDSVDLCAVEVGGIVNAAGTPGVLQLGPEIGTFNNILGVGLLFTPYTADGQGFFQGGGPGFAVAGMFNIAAITAWFGSSGSSEEMKLKPKLPRGGL